MNTIKLPTTLDKWTKFCEEEMDRLSTPELPITRESLAIAIPGSKSHCTIATDLARCTGMDSKANQIDVDAQYIRFVLNGKRYFLIHEVAGAEHIKQLDTLALCEENGAKVLDKFKPFILKLRFHAERPVYARVRVKRSLTVPQSETEVPQSSEIAVTTEKDTKIEPVAETAKEREPVAETAKENNKKDIPSAAVISQRRTRIDAGKIKSRWAR
jgi:hypothetical protein